MIGTSTPVLQFTKDGKLVAEYKSIRSAAIAIGTSAGNVYQCCSPKHYLKTVKGYIFKFKDSEETLNQLANAHYGQCTNEIIGGK